MATYTGPAAGRFVIDPQIGDATAGGFTASATLEVDFGDATAPGTVSGTADGFPLWPGQQVADGQGGPVAAR